ncbi:MAG: hypothetical protein DCC51_04945 [Anaerolineae bacterium]|nr:MAG: hypothetical protein DCC51_04945 [Anaerolineae bacterium]
MRDARPVNSGPFAGQMTGATGALSDSQQRVIRLARVWAGIAVAVMLINVVLVVRHVAATGDTTNFLSHQFFLPVSVLVYCLLAVMVITHRPANPIGWLFLVTGSAYALTALSAGIIVYGSSSSVVGFSTFTDLALWLNNWIWIPATILPTTFVFLLFPDGHLPSPRWRPIAWAAGLGLALVVFGLALHPGPVESWVTARNPYGLTAAKVALDAVINLGTFLLLIGGTGSILAILSRYRRSRGIEREQMKWLAYAAALIMIFAVVAIPLTITGMLAEPQTLDASIILTNLAMLLIGVAAAIAIVGYRLYDIDVIISRTLVYGVMTGIIILIYSLVVGAASVLFDSQGNWLLALLATGLVAVLFQPIRDRLQRGVNRLLYGQRDEPIEVLTRLGQSLEQTITPDLAYSTIVETVAQAMRLPYVAIQIPQGGRRWTAGAYGVPGNEPVSYELTYQGDVAGWLLVGRRAPDEALNPADDLLLRNIARQAGAAVHNAQLTADLQRSRQQIVASREEERLRLRRDLHDGLGPSLASLLLESRALRRMIRDDPAAAEKLVDEMQGDIRATIDDIRRVVNELRPPALDDLGFVPAIQVLAGKLSRPASGASADLVVHVEAPEDIPPLPAAVEVAAYRIIQEALTNVTHHAEARQVWVCLQLGRELDIEVSDDGRGINGGRQGGLGLRSMRERAAELGGNVTVSRRPEGGTKVRASLPLGGV